MTGYKTSTNRTGQTINPRYSTTLRFNFSQPLLKNFGSKMSRREILVAKNNLGVSDETLRKTLMDTVYSVESAYWNLVYSIENLEVRKQSLQLAKDLLEKNQRSVEVGTLAPMEVLSAQAEVATREADLIQAEVQIKSNEDQMKQLLRFTEAEDKAVTAIFPRTSPPTSPGRSTSTRPSPTPSSTGPTSRSPASTSRPTGSTSATPRTRSCRSSTSTPRTTARASTGRSSSTRATP